MKPGRSKKTKVTKGTTSAVILSVAIHVGLFLLAGMLVVFTVVNKEEKTFEPPRPVERAKMKLKKPKVKVKKSAKPKSTQRIVTKVQKADMPDIQLPEMSGLGEGMGDGSFGGGFDLLPDLDEINVIGRSQTDGSDLEGTFYDFNRLRNGNLKGIDMWGLSDVLKKFHRSGWDESVLSKYYRSPVKLYANTVAVPPMPSPMVPIAFNEPDNEDKCWIVLYKGKLVHKDGIRFRFVGNSDDKLAVRVDGKVVLDACRHRDQLGLGIAEDWSPSSADHLKWYFCHDYSAVGDLVELEPGVPKDIEIIIGEGPGVLFNAILYVMEEGVEYETGPAGAPILPLYKTAPLPRQQQDMIYRGMPKDQVDVTSGPVFNDYYTHQPEPEDAVASSDEGEAVPEEKGGAVAEPISSHTWIFKDGTSVDAEYVLRIGTDIVLETARGRHKKYPVDGFTQDDLDYITLIVPPELKLELSKKTAQRRIKHDAEGLIGIIEHTFTPKISTDDKDYDHRLKVDYWVIGSEINGSQYLLLDKGHDFFVPSECEDGKFQFSGKTRDLYKWTLKVNYNENRGERYKGFLITVTDERGVIIAHRSSPTWLFKHLHKLKKLGVGSFMDDECNQVWPTPLKEPAIL